ncbi:MAG: hypothetical protein AAF725_15415, partial [Acidobacteriota bacterium]
ASSPEASVADLEGPDIADLLIVPAGRGASGVLPAAEWAGEDFAGSRSRGPGAGPTSRLPLLASRFKSWPARCGEPPDPAFLAYTLAEGGQPMEAVLAALEAGKRLYDAGFRMLVGPSLSPESLAGGDARLAARVTAALAEGFSAAGLLWCVGGFTSERWGPRGSASGDALPYGAALASGVEAVCLDAAGAEEPRGEALRRTREDCRALREDLAFGGLIVAPEAGRHPAELIAAGCDLVWIDGDEGARSAATVAADRLRTARRLSLEILQAWR